jgi:hypothetical protein
LCGQGNFNLSGGGIGIIKADEGLLMDLRLAGLYFVNITIPVPGTQVMLVVLGSYSGSDLDKL